MTRYHVSVMFLCRPIRWGVLFILKVGRTWCSSNAKPNNKLWRFTADGLGSGSWSPVSLGSDDILSPLIPTEGAAVETVGDVGYALGGTISNPTNCSTADTCPPSTSLFSFNMASGELTTRVAPAQGNYEAAIYGKAEYIPFGE